MKNLVFRTLLALGFCLAAGAAMAGECRTVQARVGAGEWLDPPCYRQGLEFVWCAVTPIMGNFNGTWYYLGPPNNGVPINPGAPYASPTSGGFALAVFETNQGELWAQDSWRIDWSNMTSDGGLPFVSILNITGGTDRYEGASGWLGVIGADASRWKGFLKGEICTP